MVWCSLIIDVVILWHPESLQHVKVQTQVDARESVIIQMLLDSNADPLITSMAYLGYHNRCEEHSVLTLVTFLGTDDYEEIHTTKT